MMVEFHSVKGLVYKDPEPIPEPPPIKVGDAIILALVLAEGPKHDPAFADAVEAAWLTLKHSGNVGEAFSIVVQALQFHCPDAIPLSVRQELGI